MDTIGHMGPDIHREVSIPYSGAIIVAAGSGARLGADVPKALVEAAGRSLVSWCLAAFDASPRVASIVIVAPSGHLPAFRALAAAAATPVAVVPGGATRAGFASVVDGFRFLRTAPNVRMTFVADIAAMLLAQPRVIFPAAGAVILGGGARTVGYLYAASAVGAVLATLVSGRLGSVRRQGVAIMVSIVGWGVGISGLGVALLGAGEWLTLDQALWASLFAMAVAGACDAVSAVFRTTILQSAAPDRMRGRLQGVFIVVVAGGPRLGELLGGVVAERIGEGWMAVWGGVACIVAIGALSLRHRHFLRYDARHPTP